MGLTNPYTILGVSKNASKDEITKAYHKLANKYHPDKCIGADSGKFLEIKEAYEILMKLPPKIQKNVKPKKEPVNSDIIYFDFEPKVDLWGNPLEKETTDWKDTYHGRYYSGDMPEIR